VRTEKEVIAKKQKEKIPKAKRKAKKARGGGKKRLKKKKKLLPGEPFTGPR